MRLITIFILCALYIPTFARELSILSHQSTQDVAKVMSQGFWDHVGTQEPVVKIDEGAELKFCAQGYNQSPAILLINKPSRLLELCKDNNVILKEMPLGNRALVLISNKDENEFDFSLYNIIRSISHESQAKTWQDIDKNLPHSIIRFYIVRPSGFIMNFLKYIVASDKGIRTNNAIINWTGDNKTLLKNMQEHEDAIAIIRYIDIDQDIQKNTRMHTLNGIFPSKHNIESGKYALNQNITAYYRQDMLQHLNNNDKKTLNSMIKYLQDTTGFATQYNKIGIIRW